MLLSSLLVYTINAKKSCYFEDLYLPDFQLKNSILPVIHQVLFRNNETKQSATSYDSTKRYQQHNFKFRNNLNSRSKIIDRHEQLRAVFIIADDFETDNNNEILTFYLKPEEKTSFHDFEKKSYLAIFDDFSSIYDSNSSFFDTSSNITWNTYDYQNYSEEDEIQHDFYQDDYMNNFNDINTTNYDDSYLDDYDDYDEHDYNIQSLDTEFLIPQHTTYEKVTSSSDSFTYTYNSTNNIQRHDIYSNLNRAASASGSHRAAAIQYGPSADDMTNSEKYDEILSFYSYSVNTANKSLLIHGGDFVGDISTLPKILSQRVGSRTIITIGAHGNRNDLNGQHELSFGPSISQSQSQSQAFPSLTISTVSLLSQLLKASESSEPLHIHLDTCYATPLQLGDVLTPETVLIINSRDDTPSISSLSTMKHKQLIQKIQRVSGECSATAPAAACALADPPQDPYSTFLDLIAIEAAQKSTFVTRTQFSTHVYSLSPPLETLLSQDQARRFLLDAVKSFIAFSSSMTWLGQPVQLQQRSFEAAEVDSFSGNMFIYLCALGRDDFIDFLVDLVDHSPQHHNQYLLSLFNRNASGDFPVHIAAAFGHTRILGLYLSQSLSRPLHFPVDRLNDWGASALYMSCSNNHLDTALLLLQAGADPNLSCRLGGTPLFAAAIYGHYAMAELLLRSGAAVDSGDAEGSTPLMVAGQNNHVLLVSLLLEYGATAMRPREQNGNTALHIAVIRGNVDVVKLLLLQCDAQSRATADCAELMNAAGVPPLVMAAQEGYAAVVELLLDHGAGVDSSSRSGNTALIAAAAFGHQHAVSLLLLRGADVTKENHACYSALQAAQEYPAILRLLLRHA